MNWLLVLNVPLLPKGVIVISPSGVVKDDKPDVSEAVIDSARAVPQIVASRQAGPTQTK
jgi:hypothetical protein